MIEWLTNTDPKILPGILTLATALIASLTALAIAFFAYPWQKKKDRAFETHRERREVYRNFLGTMNDFFTSILQKKTGEASEQQMILHRVATDFLCFASQAAAVAARGYIDAVQEYRKITFDAQRKKNDPKNWQKDRTDAQKKCFVARNEAVTRMRVDLTDEEFEVCQKIVNAHFSDGQHVSEN